MSLEEFMKHAADAAYMGDADLLRGYAQQILKERDEARAEGERLRRSRKVWNKLLKGAIRQAEARGARRAAATDERGVCLGCGRLVATRQDAGLSDHHPTCPVMSKARR